MDPEKIVDEVCQILLEADRPLRSRELSGLLAERGVSLAKHELDEILFSPAHARAGLAADRAFQWTYTPPSRPAAAPAVPPPAEPLVRRPSPMSAVDARLAQSFARLADASRELRQTRMRVERVEDMLEGLARELGQLKSFVARERTSADPGAPALDESLFGLEYRDARKRAIEEFELAYARGLVERHGGNVSRAAEAAGVHRNVLHRILSRSRDAAAGSRTDAQDDDAE